MPARFVISVICACVFIISCDKKSDAGAFSCKVIKLYDWPATMSVMLPDYIDTFKVRPRDLKQCGERTLYKASMKPKWIAEGAPVKDNVMDRFEISHSNVRGCVDDSANYFNNRRDSASLPEGWIVTKKVIDTRVGKTYIKTIYIPNEQVGNVYILFNRDNITYHMFYPTIAATMDRLNGDAEIIARSITWN